MKPTLLLLAFAPAILSAQIALNSDDFPSGESTFQVATDLTASGFDPDATGADMEWDFSELQPLTEVEEGYVSVSGTPFAYQFLFNNPFDPGYQSTHAAPIGSFDQVEGLALTDIYTYYKNSSSDYRLTGSGFTVNGIPLAAKSEPVDVMFEFPVEFGNSHSDYTTTTFQIPTLLTYKLKQTRTTEVDGWGTLTIPAGTFEVLRIKTTLDITDSISFSEFGIDQEIPRPQSIEYRWWAAGYHVPMLLITTSFDQTTGVRFYNGPLSVNESAEQAYQSVTAFPNPAIENFSLNGLPIGSDIKLFESSGRIVVSERYTGRVDVRSIAPGLYSIVTPNGSVKLMKH